MVREVDNWIEYENGFRYRRGSEEELSFEYAVSLKVQPLTRQLDDGELASVRTIVEQLGKDIQDDPHVRPFIMLRGHRDSGDHVVYFHHPLPLIYQAILAERLSHHCKNASAMLGQYDLFVSTASTGWRVFFGMGM